jgi:diacylglycerol O-acyltransferase / trehalose O-mycolyltransferase
MTVLYLLTGNGAGFQSWTCNTLVQNYLQNAEVIVVMPDGAQRYDRCAPAEKIPSTQIPSWYSDWKTPSSDRRAQKWETFHLDELKRILETSYRSSGKYAIAGLSMGGFGAIKYAVRHPGLFVAAASYSGMLDTISNEGFTAITGSLTQAGQDTNALWGYYPDTPFGQQYGSDWPLHNPKTRATELLNTATHMLKIPIYISAGDGSLGKLVPNYDIALGSIEAAVRSATNRFVLTVSNANGGVRPTNMTVKYYKGTHQWRYWDAAMCASLPMLMSALGVSYTPLLTCNTL